MTRGKPAPGWGILIVMAGAIAACGTQQQLQPKAGHRLPVGPQGQDQPQTAEQLLEPEAAQRPNRSEELLKRSEPRKPDPFDLPPS